MKLAQKLAVKYIRTKFQLLTAISKRKAAQKAFDLFCTPMFRNLNAIPEVFEESERLDFPFNSFRIRGYRWNKGGIKKVLIIHGFESSVVNFDEYVKSFIKKNYEVLAFDAPAHGRSSGKKVNALIFRDFIKYIVATYGPIDRFMAHSFGALSLSLALAETPHSENTYAVLIAPATETNTAINQFFDFIGVPDPQVRKEFEQIIYDMGHHPVSWYSIGRALHSIRARVLWLHDEDDQVTPFADAQKVKESNFYHVHFVVTKGLGHRRIYRDPEVHKQIIDFL